MGQPTIYNTALYLRLSRDDGTDCESSSIQTQKEMLTRYARDNGFVPYQIYCDDGWSGTNSNRPDFQRMLSDIENGKINCVITKDLSRLGRNYLETGSFTEIYFPEHNCRYIAVTDGVDTSKGSTMDITPFKNLLIDMYNSLSKTQNKAKQFYKYIPLHETSISPTATGLCSFSLDFPQKVW